MTAIVDWLLTGPTLLVACGYLLFCAAGVAVIAVCVAATAAARRYDDHTSIEQWGQFLHDLDPGQHDRRGR